MGMANVYREPTALERAMTERIVADVQSVLTTALSKFAKNDPQLQAADYKKMCEARLKSMVDSGQVASGKVCDPAIAHSFYVDRDGTFHVHWRHYKGGRSYSDEWKPPRRVRSSRRRSRVFCKRHILGTIAADILIVPIPPAEQIHFIVELDREGFSRAEHNDWQQHVEHNNGNA